MVKTMVLQIRLLNFMIYFLFLVSFFFFLNINGIIQYVVWLVSLSIEFLKIIHVIACINTPTYLWLNNIPLYGNTICVYPIDCAAGTCVVSLLAIMSKLL